MPSKKGNGSGNSVEEETEMRPWLVSGMIVTILWGCAALSPVTVRDPIPQDYAFQRLESDDMSVHWNIVQGEGGVVVTGRENTFLVRADYWWQPFDDNRRSIFGW